MATVLKKHPSLMNILDYYNTAVYPWNSHWGGRKPTALFTYYYFSLRVWWCGWWPTWPIMHVNRHVLKQSWYLAGWNYIQYDQHSHDGTLFTYWPESAALTEGLGVMTVEGVYLREKKKKNLQKPSRTLRWHASIILYSVKNRTMQKSVLLLV